MALTAEQVRILIIIERTAASISATSTLILVATFCSMKVFRTLSNHLIFYASFANLFASMAVLIGGDALHDKDGPLCQFQAFLLQMFMQSDPLWACAMAVNVYLVIFMRYDPIRLKKLHWVYFLLCYGLPLIPAMFCLFYRTEERGKIYGDATLWCWIDHRWTWVRIWSYYLPIWISIVISLGIYWFVGFEIYRVRAQIRALEASTDHTSNNFNSGTFNSTLMTSQTVTSGTLTDHRKDSQIPAQLEGAATPDQITPLREDELWRIDSTNYSYYARESRLGSQARDEEHGNLPTSPQQLHPSNIYFQHHASSPLDPVYPFSPAHPPPSPHSASHSPQRTTMDKVKWAYTKCALLFGVSILITWVPASINRVHGLAHEANPSFVLNVLSAIVLPLQGFWNMVIFFTTSWSITRRTARRWLKNYRTWKAKNGSGEVKEQNTRKLRDRENGLREEQRKGRSEKRRDDESAAVNQMADGNSGPWKGKSRQEGLVNSSNEVEQASGRSSDRTLTAGTP